MVPEVIKNPNKKNLRRDHVLEFDLMANSKHCIFKEIKNVSHSKLKLLLIGLLPFIFWKNILVIHHLTTTENKDDSFDSTVGRRLMTDFCSD
jgi:hypothetical protein